jgi:CrcB protein
MVGAVAVGGAAGALTRACAQALTGVDGGAFPWPVLLVNVVGSLCLGALTVLVLAYEAPRWVGPALGTGFLGGFTTFSGYVVAAEMLVQQGAPAMALGYAVLTPLLCVGSAAAGAQSIRVAAAVSAALASLRGRR